MFFLCRLHSYQIKLQIYMVGWLGRLHGFALFNIHTITICCRYVLCDSLKGCGLFFAARCGVACAVHTYIKLFAIL